MLPTIKLGADGDVAKIAQCLLVYDPADGIFDARFEEFVKEWQTAEGLTVDGIIGPSSWKAILAKLPTVSTRKFKYSTYTMAIQLILGIDADGIFGPKTQSAVKTHQAAAGLSADGIVGQKTWSAMILGSQEQPEEDTGEYTFVQPKDFKQYDSKWANKMYSNHGDKNQTMRSSACGPTSGADVVYTWWDDKVTPYTIAQDALAWGCRTKNSGTTGNLFSKLSNKYSQSKKYGTTKSLETAIKCLRTGGYVVVCFGPGSSGQPGYKKWTKGGHYCVIWKYENGIFYINDPASSKAARAKGTYDEVKACRKGFYLIWR